MRNIALFCLIFLVGCSASVPANSVFMNTGELVGESLKEAGIEDFYIEVSSEEIIIHVESPPVETDADILMQWTYMWSVAAMQSNQEIITIIQYVDEVPIIQVSAKSEKIRDLISEKISFPEFADTTETEMPETEWVCSSSEVLIEESCF